MKIDETIKDLEVELQSLKSRLVVDDEMMDHLYRIYELAFCSWYDPDNDEHEKWGEKLWPHIKALNDKLKFKR
jgi:hypothetical protein